MKQTGSFVTAYDVLLQVVWAIAHKLKMKFFYWYASSGTSWKGKSASLGANVAGGWIHYPKRESLLFAPVATNSGLTPPNRWLLVIPACFILTVLSACGESEKSEAQISTSEKPIVNGRQSVDTMDHTTADQERGPFEEADGTAALSQIFQVLQKNETEVSTEPITAGLLLKAERDLKDFDMKSALSEGETRIPPLVLSADITEIPLRRVLVVLGRRIGAKIFIAKDLDDEISVRFSKLPLEQGIERILKGRNYVLIRNQIPGGGVKVAEIRVLSRNSDETAELKELDTVEERTAELAVLTTRALEAIKAEDRLAALNELVETTDRENDSQLTDVLVSALKDKDAGVRGFAVGAIGSVSNPPAEPVIEMALGDENPELRIGALEELIAIHGEDVARPVFEEARGDPDARVQATAEGLFRPIRTDEFEEE